MRLHIVLCGVLWALPSRAHPAHVENRCPGLSPAVYDELDARLVLLLNSEGNSEALPSLVCTPQGSWLEWRGARFDLPGKAAIPDEALDIVEAQLRTSEPERDTAPTADKDLVAASSVRASAQRSRGRGITLAFETEVPSATLATSVGPAFEFGADVGPLTLGLREAFRFTVAGRQVSFMDFELVAGYGAPFKPARPWGAVARLGAEGMAAYPAGGAVRFAVVPVAGLGLRLAQGFGALHLWLGVDAWARLAPLALRLQSERVAARDVSGTLSVGFAYVD